MRAPTGGTLLGVARNGTGMGGTLWISDTGQTSDQAGGTGSAISGGNVFVEIASS